MELLKKRILTDGTISEGNILRVDSFLNHQIDVKLLNEIGKELQRRFQNETITKILTIEVSGIAIASIAAQYFDVPVVFAKKHQGINSDPDSYESHVFSYTKKQPYSIKVSKKFLSKDDKILIIDDFLASGSAVSGLLDILEQSEATVSGVGIIIEKNFQEGRQLLESKNIHLESLAIIDSISDGTVNFA
ncbi:xanthine phosphoribosyltransferase [Clostridium cylindrosporum]|uniref:Xanthine phosphoribosyltransferase n=1 Tax=Clostridium cylindrosporum DSM 605 TaxID=1121307 RepID=A0A0J8D5F7_CLOCY|nr:xanthine phosphoribosyltransferase [Clostridium cylindrosporum]KMT21380.1 xanthine phosphoribosyltransferase Xpt [Clostridium cylindrosporum DSM 605]